MRMQAVGFAMLFVLYLLCATLYNQLANHSAAFQVSGCSGLCTHGAAHRLHTCNTSSSCPQLWALLLSSYHLHPPTQALYYLASFFNNFGPNATTFLVAGEASSTVQHCVEGRQGA